MELEGGRFAIMFKSSEKFKASHTILRNSVFSYAKVLDKHVSIAVSKITDLLKAQKGKHY